MIDENTVKRIIEEEFQRLVKENPNGPQFHLEQAQAIEDRLELIEERLGM
jgi:hypothetical protein